MAARPIWTGTVSLGVLNVPVKMYAATESEASGLFHMVCREHGDQVRFQRWCEHDGAPHKLDQDQIGKGVRVGGQMVTISDSDLDSLPKGIAKTMEVREFVPTNTVPLEAREKLYHVGPDKLSVKAYALLATMLELEQVSAVVTMVMREREHLAVLEAQGGRISLWFMHRAAEVRDITEVPLVDADAEVSEAELGLARMLVVSMKGDRFDAEQYPDKYAEAVRSLAEKGAAEQTPETPEPEVADLMASLMASVSQAKAKREAA